MQKILSNIRNNKEKTLLCILSVFIIELAPLILLIETPNDNSYDWIIILFLFAFICCKNLIFIFFYVIKNKFLYNILEKIQIDIKSRLLLLILLFICDIFFILTNKYIAFYNDNDTLAELYSLYLGLIPIYTFFLLLFSKKGNILSSKLGTNIIYIAEKILYLIICIKTIYPILMALFILFFVATFRA